jgi:peptide/nickel transport system permease protein
VAVAEPFRVELPRSVRLRRSPRLEALRRVGWIDRVAFAGVAVVTIIAVFAPLIAPHSASATPGQPFIHPFSGGFLLGTDDVGRDIFSRVLFGISSTWLSALFVISSGVLIGGLVGLVAGASGGWIDAVLMRITDIFLALPGPVLAITIVAALGPSLWHTLIAVMIVWWPLYARIVRGEVRALASRPHMEAARLAGVGRFRLTFRHLMPGAIPSTIVAASLDVSALIITLSSLSFLGLGAPAPAPELGAMSARGINYLIEYSYVPLIPALAVFAVAIVANLAGDGARDLIGDR